MKRTSQLEQEYNKKQLAWKASIRMEPNKNKRFWKWIWYFIAFPFVWIFTNIRDWRTAIIFVITFIVLSCEVWVPYLIYFITGNLWMLGVGSACWLFWAGPGTPFLLIVIIVTMGIKGLFNKLKKRS